jgi:hypothetical protein
MEDKALRTSATPDEEATSGGLVEHEPSFLEERVGPSPLRVLKGVGGIATVWAGGWAVLGLAFALTLSGTMGFPMYALLPSAISWGIGGFLSGAGFATLLTTMERKSLLEELSLARVAGWGALGGFAVYFLVLLTVGVLPFLGLPWALFEAAKAGVLGAISAVGTTAIAKSAGDGPVPDDS